MTTRPVNLVRSLPGMGSGIKTDPPVERAPKKAKGGMNKLEAQFAEWLKAHPDHPRWVFGSIKLRLADRTWYTPDFFVWWPVTETTGVFEVKGSWKAPHQEDSRVKLKVAADLYPQLSFAAATLDKRSGEWEFEWFGSRGR